MAIDFLGLWHFLMPSLSQIFSPSAIKQLYSYATTDEKEDTLTGTMSIEVIK